MIVTSGPHGALRRSEMPDRQQVYQERKERGFTAVTGVFLILLGDHSIYRELRLAHQLSGVSEPLGADLSQSLALIRGRWYNLSSRPSWREDDGRPKQNACPHCDGLHFSSISLARDIG